MKNARRCPKCDGTARYHVSEMTIPHYEFTDAVRPNTLTASMEVTAKTLFGDRRERTPVTMEAFVCATCGYTELYTKDLKVLERFAKDQLGSVTREP